MIRLKAKNILLSIMLVLASVCFFACNDTKVKVDSIAFTEQSIDLLVGEEYSPSIKILPSYASDRSYTLISGDATALSVDGGTITALKAGRGIKLKVVSNENENINDMISVNIYDEATDLDVPTDFTFDGTTFSFDAVDNVSSYMLKVGEQEFNIGNNTEYLFENLVSRYNGDLYNVVLDYSVKAVGDGKIFKDSDYCEAKQYVNLGVVENAYVEEEILYVEPIENVASYKVEIISEGKTVISETIQNTSFATQELTLSLSNLTDSINGAEYVITITPEVEGYNGNNLSGVFASKGLSINYIVLGKVQNVNINGYTLTWNFVKNATEYVVEIYKLSDLSNPYKIYESVLTNGLTLDFDASGEYVCKVIARANSINTTDGRQNSDDLNFKILPAPTVTALNNKVEWNTVDGAEGYLVNIWQNGVLAIENKFVVTNVYDVQPFVDGEYSIEVSASGNGTNILTSSKSQSASWTKLKALTNVNINNKKLSWKDVDEKSTHKYGLKFNVNDAENVEIELTNADLHSQYIYDADEEIYIYDLSTYDFDANTHNIIIQSLGQGNIFDANANATCLIKLEDASINSLSDKKFTINTVANAVRYEIAIYNASDTSFTSPILTGEVGNEGFTLDDSKLGAGTYVARVSAYGNGGNILDASNGVEGTTFGFEKLATPSLTIDTTNLLVQVGTITNANGYKLYQNAEEVNLTDNAYEISSLSAGDYVYLAQALGNGTNVLDSNITATSQAKTVKKLATPTLEFDKDKCIYTITCADNDFVVNYVFKLDDVEVAVSGNKADCSSVMTESKTYVAEVVAMPKTDANYTLIMQSEKATHEAEKLNGECGVKVENGKIIITPTTTLTDENYTLNVKVENENKAVLHINDLPYINSHFEIELYDEQYDFVEYANEGGVKFFTEAGAYTFYTTLVHDDDDVVNSSEIEGVNKLTALPKVANIERSSQDIAFDRIENATGFIAYITINNETYYLGVTGIYTSGTTNALPVLDLVALMEGNKVPYAEETEYTIGFVSISNDNTYIPSKSEKTYTFEFLSTPTIGINEQGNIKYLVVNAVENATLFNAIFTQNETIKNIWITKNAEKNSYSYDLSNLTNFVAGSINIEVKSSASSGNYFDSKASTFSVNKITSTGISIVDGLLTWSVVPNAKQYNLYYTANGATKKIELYEGVEGFSISGESCVYDFDELSGQVSLYLQVDSILQVEDQYYINSNNGTTLENIYKLPTLPISIVNGNIYTEIQKSDLLLVKNIAIKVDGKDINIDITQASEGVDVVDKGLSLAITIDPTVILKYPSTSERTPEEVTLQMFANNSTTLNSNISSKVVYGLLKPTNLDVTTSTTQVEDTTIIKEVFEKMTWKNPTANLNDVIQYNIVITYDEKPYNFTSNETSFMMPKYYDADADGELDEDEVEFGAGVYTIKVMALTDNDVNVANSQYCDELTVTILATPTELQTKGGNIAWSGDSNVEYYLIRVYLLNNGEKQLLVSTETKTNEYDLSKLEPFKTEGVYGVSVQAMHSNSKVLASDESELFEVIRLPKAKGYYVKDGRLYIRVHSFFTTAEIYLAKDSASETSKLLFTIDNSDLAEYNAYINSMTGWSTSQVIETYKNDEYYVDIAYINENDYTLRKALAEGYTVEIKLLGNSVVNKGAIISGHTLSPAENLNFDNDTIVKLIAPTVKVSDTVRGQVELNIHENLKYTNLNYFVQGATALRGVQLYEINIKADTSYTFYIAEIIDQTEFKKCTTIETNEEYDLKYFVYKNQYFNVMDAYTINFNDTNYRYYSATGEVCGITAAKAGSFIVNARFIGDDTYFVQSNISNDVTIKRYDVLDISVNNGALSWKNQADANDRPIYIMTLTLNETTKYELVLYADPYTEESVKAYLDPNNTLSYIYDKIVYTLEDENIIYTNLANIIAKTTGSDLGGTYTASIMAYCSEDSSNDKLIAQSVIPKTITILPQAPISVNNGTITWQMADVDKSDAKEYIYKYLFEVFDADGNKLYSTTLSVEQDAEGNYVGDYIIKDGIATYELPRSYGLPEVDEGVQEETGEEINNDSNEEISANLNEDVIEDVDEETTEEAGEQTNTSFAYTPNTEYKFAVTALGGDSSTYISSVNSKTDNILLLPLLEDIRMEDGVLQWNNPTTKQVKVYLTCSIGGKDVVYTPTVTGNRFDLPTVSVLDITGTSVTFISGYTYSMQVRICGDSTSINGFYNEIPVKAERLPNIDNKALTSNNGELTWNKIDISDTEYVVSYTLSNGTQGKSEALKTNSFDFAGLVAGNITATVKAYNSNYFASFASDEIALYKLVPPTDITFNQNETTITWKKAVDNNGKEVESYRVSIKENGVVTNTYNCSSNVWKITGVTSNVFEIAVSTISTSTSGMLINSDYTNYVEMVQPNAVEQSSFKFNEDMQRFEFMAIADEQPDDKYYIGYNYYPAGSSSEDARQPDLVTESETIDGQKYYYYYPHEIGTYLQIYVQVLRAGSLSSQATYYKNKAGELKLEFYLFADGDGSTGDPYIITNETELRNIKYFLSANYIIDLTVSDLKLTQSLQITNEKQAFKGSISGNGNYYIRNTIQADESVMLQEYAGLFAKVENATFKNIKLTGFNFAGYLNTQELYLGVLAGKATNSTFENVTIVSSTISVVKNNQIGFTSDANIYVGGITGHAVDCTFTNCEVVLTKERDVENASEPVNLNITGTSGTQINVGVFAGIIENGKITSDTDKLTVMDVKYSVVALRQESPVIYFGGKQPDSEQGANQTVVGEDDGATYNIRKV